MPSRAALLRGARELTERGEGRREKMEFRCCRSIIQLLLILGSVLSLDGGHFLLVRAEVHYYDFVLKEIEVTKLCESQSILTVNGLYPGPEIRVHKGDTVFVNVTNEGNYGVTIHWHGVKQPRNSWSDGPVFTTQCPILPGSSFIYEVIFSDEEGTLWWHAHSDWTRSTVHGPIIILPKEGTTYPFPKPDAEKVLVLGSWYKGNLNEMVNEDLLLGKDIPHSAGYVMNGELGDFASCSSVTTHRWPVVYGKTYMMRIISAVVDDFLFFAIADHNMTIVAVDASYVKPVSTDYIMISPGQTMDVLITMDQPLGRYYMASRQYLTENKAIADTNTGSAIIEYVGEYNTSSTPAFPSQLPHDVDTQKAITNTFLIRSLANEDYPIDVPLNVTTRMFIVIGMGELCRNRTNCNVTANNLLASTMNNISWADPIVDVLEAYYWNLSGYYTTDFPDWPPTMYNFTANVDYPNLYMTDQGTRVKVLEYNETVEIVFQSSAVADGSSAHPMHLHGYSFYVLGSGYGNYDNETDPLRFNLVDPPKVNTYLVPRDGWLAIRFTASNPGVWLWHCHFERHLSWGMDTVFIVKNGGTEDTSLRPPPDDMPTCIGFPHMSISKSNSTADADADRRYL